MKEFLKFLLCVAIVIGIFGVMLFTPIGAIFLAFIITIVPIMIGLAFIWFCILMPVASLTYELIFDRIPKWDIWREDWRDKYIIH